MKKLIPPSRVLLIICYLFIFFGCSADTDIVPDSDDPVVGQEEESTQDNDEEDNDEESNEEDEPTEEPETQDRPPLLRLNSGGPEIDLDGTLFSADAYFQASGNTYTNNEVTSIANTDYDQLYLTERSSNSDLAGFGYAIPITNGSYEVRMHFAEIFFGATGGASGGSGSRVFSVSIEGETILIDYDIIEEVGSLTAVIESFEITVDDNELNIDFTASVNRPKLSGLEIFGDGAIMEDTAESCTWNDLSSSQFSKLESQSVALNNKLYVFAGFTNDLQITDITEVYDVSSDTWNLGAPMPIAVTHMGAVMVGTDVWIVGGFVGDHPGVATDKVQIYNTVTDTWSEGPPLPEELASGAAVLNNNKIHYFGGLLPDRVTDSPSHYVLNLDDMGSGWQSLAELPDARNHLGGAAVDGKIYAIGGQFGHDGGPTDLNLLHVYDPVTDVWSTKSPLPYPRSHFEPGTIVHDGKIIIVGGRNGSLFYDNVTQYDPDTDLWSELCVLPEENLAPAAKIFGDKLIVANGGDGGTCCPLNTTRWIFLQ